MTELITSSSWGFSRESLKKLIGLRAIVWYIGESGRQFSRSGEIANVGLKNVTVSVASGRNYKISLATILAVKTSGVAVTAETVPDSMRLCLSCACSYVRNGRWFCSADKDMKSSVTDSTICGDFDELHERCGGD